MALSQSAHIEKLNLDVLEASIKLLCSQKKETAALELLDKFTQDSVEMTQSQARQIIALKSYIEECRVKNRIKKLVKIVPGKSLDEIPVADKPLPQGAKVKYVKRDELEKKFKCSLSESLWYRPNKAAKKAKKVWDKNLSEQKHSDLEKEILNRLEHPFTDFAVCDIDEKLGAGLFALKDIPKGTILGQYAGVRSPKLFDDYSFGLSAKNTKISSKLKGGLVRFAQHMPTPQELSLYYRFNNQATKNTIATANVEVKAVKCCGIDMLVFVANTDIKANEQIGISYGMNYWKNRGINPFLFNKKGEPVPHDQYLNRLMTPPVPVLPKPTVVEKPENRVAALGF